MENKSVFIMLKEKERQFQKAKTKRLITTLAGFTALYYVVFWQMDKPSGLDILANILVSLFFAVLHILLNAPIFHFLYERNEIERRILDRIKKQLIHKD